MKKYLNIELSLGTTRFPAALYVANKSTRYGPKFKLHGPGGPVKQRLYDEVEKRIVEHSECRRLCDGVEVPEEKLDQVGLDASKILEFKRRVSLNEIPSTAVEGGYIVGVDAQAADIFAALRERLHQRQEALLVEIVLKGNTRRPVLYALRLEDRYSTTSHVVLEKLIYPEHWTDWRPDLIGDGYEHEEAIDAAIESLPEELPRDTYVRDLELLVLEHTRTLPVEPKVAASAKELKRLLAKKDSA